jgi:hypothetical protein
MHLRHWKPEARPFERVDEIRTTILVAGESCDNIVRDPDVVNNTESSLFHPLFERLTAPLTMSSFGDGWSSFNVQYVEEKISAILAKSSTIINSFKAVDEEWSRQRLVDNLKSVLVLPSYSDANADYLKWERLRVPNSQSFARAASPSPRGARRERAQSPSVIVAAASPASSAAKGANSAAKSTTGQNGRPPSAGREGMCHAHLLHFFKATSSGCRNNSCSYSHGIAQRSKAELLIAASALKSSARPIVEAAIHLMV